MAVNVNDMFYAYSGNEAIKEKGEYGGVVTTIMKYLLEEGIVDAVVAVEKQKLDKQYPTKTVETQPVQEPVKETPVETEPVAEEVISQNVEYAVEDSKFADLKFGDNYDVDAE